MRRITTNGRTYCREFEQPLNDAQKAIFNAFLDLPPSQNITPLGRAYHAGLAGKNLPRWGQGEGRGELSLAGLDVAAWRAGRSVFFQGARP
jgi:hypothetical protein